MPEVCINEILCYVKCKLELVTIKQLKLVLHSFYNEDELSCAKQLLFDAASTVIDNFPRFIKRSKSDNRSKLIVDDITEYLQKIDESNSWDKLPTYVAQNLARIPTVSIEDIETFIMAQKIENLEIRMKKLEVDRIRGDVIGDGEVQRVSEIASSTAAETVTSVGANVLAMASSAGVTGTDGEGTWSTVARRGVKKNSGSNIKIVGNKTQTSSIEAAKSLQRKFIFHLDNVKTDQPCSVIESYLSDNGIEVINCFSAKSWIHTNPDTQDSSYAYRVCVKYEDKSKILDGAFWSNGVVVREWRFKKPVQNGVQ